MTFWPTLLILSIVFASNCFGQVRHRYQIEISGNKQLHEAVCESIRQHRLSVMSGHLVGSVTARGLTIRYDAKWMATEPIAGPIVGADFIGKSTMTYSEHHASTNSQAEVLQLTLGKKLRVINTTRAFCIDRPIPSSIHVCPSGLKVLPHLHWYEIATHTWLDEDEFKLSFSQGRKIVVTENSTHIRFECSGPPGPGAEVTEYLFSKEHGNMLEHYQIVTTEADENYPTGVWAEGDYVWEKTKEGVWWAKHIEQRRQSVDKQTKKVRYYQTLLVNNEMFELIDDVSVTEADMDVSKIPTGFLYTQRDALNQVQKELYTGEFGKLEYQLKLKATEMASGDEN